MRHGALLERFLISLSNDDILHGGQSIYFLNDHLTYRYNYLTSAGLDCGLAISLIVIFIALSLPGGGISFNWWGNVGAFNTAVIYLWMLNLMMRTSTAYLF